MLQASWNGMLIDWERAGPERRFEVRVLNVLQAGKFYRDVFGADETFRQETHNGKVFRLGLSDVLDSLSRQKTISSTKGLYSLPLLRIWDPLLWRSYYALKILIIWLVPHRMRVAELQGLMSRTLLRLLPIPSAVIGHWSSVNQLLNALDDFRSRSPVVDEVPRKMA
jgi:hypothetical protein